MNTVVTIPTVIAALLPLFATMLSSWLNDDHFKPGVNAIIALVALIVTAIVCELLSGSIPLTWSLRVVVVLAYVGILMNGDLSVLYTYLVAKPSPVSSALGLNTPTPTPPQSPVSAPKPIVIPPAPPAQSTPDQVA